MAGHRMAASGGGAWPTFDFIQKGFYSSMGPVLDAGIQDEQGQVTAFLELFLFIGQLIRPNP